MMKDGSVNGSIDETAKAFQGHPKFPGGYPKGEDDHSYPGRYTYPQQAIEPEMHWKNDMQMPPSPSDYPDMPYDGLIQQKYVANYFKGQYVSFSKEDDDKQHLIDDKAEHFIRDYNDPALKGKDKPASNNNPEFSKKGFGSKSPWAGKWAEERTYDKMFDESADKRSSTRINEFGAERPVFSGSTTLVNPTDDSDKSDILENSGLERYERKRVRALNDTHNHGNTSNQDGATSDYINNHVPLSPLHPFLRLDSDDDRGPKNINSLVKQSLFLSYNRTHIPMADVEFRKGFRHTFFNRPECYVMYSDNGNAKLCRQAAKDEDFSSLFYRMPHVVTMLAPSYITGVHGVGLQPDGMHAFSDNWNYLLSNRVLGLSPTDETLSQKETMTKTPEGYTITPGLHLESRTGSTIQISFRETKDLEVSEFIKAWMLYIHKRARGYFEPPYNGYQYINDWFETNRKATSINPKLNGNHINRLQLHPYDRALEYCASIFDFVTNESDNKVIYWCKYFGVYPVAITNPLSNENNGPLGAEGLKVDVTFRYQYKLPCTNRTLIEFNYNSGICDALGNLRIAGKPTFSHSFLVKDPKSEIKLADSVSPDPCKALTQYIGAAGMFTGTPMILMAAREMNPLSDRMGNEDLTCVPVLRFADITDPQLNTLLNLGFNYTASTEGQKIQYAFATNNYT